MSKLAAIAAAVRRGRSGTGAVATPPDGLLELARTGPAPLSDFRPEPHGPLRIATVIPSFRRGSGGHATIVQLLRQLRERGHEVTVWLEDCEGRHAREPAALTQASFEDFFAADGLGPQAGFEDWQGADVVLATGWQTVARSLLLPGVAARAYLVQDHEPDFYGASAEALWAAASYSSGLYCIAASAWLAELLRERYGASASHFDLACDHDVYRPGGARRDDLVAFYARAVTPRRAVPLGLLALRELARRRPRVQIVLYGEGSALQPGFAHRNAGVLEAARLADLYREATVGMVLSLTNPSLVCLEMMACGLPCVELASDSMLASFGRDGALQLADPDPLALCDALEALLDDPVRREALGQAGQTLARERGWRQAADQVERSLRSLLAGERADEQ